MEGFLKQSPGKDQDRRPFRWAEGSDRVAVFESPEPEVQQAEINELRRYRRDLYEAGLGWITGPVELGGRGLPRRYQRIFDDLARCYAVPSAAPLTIMLGMVAPTILAHGTPGAKQRYLRALHRGDLIACQLFSEPGAGSDLPAMTASAEREGDGWRVSGHNRRYRPLGYLRLGGPRPRGSRLPDRRGSRRDPAQHPGRARPRSPQGSGLKGLDRPSGSGPHPGVALCR